MLDGKETNQILADKGITQMPSPEQFQDLIMSMKGLFGGNEVEAEDWINSALTLKGWGDSPSNPQDLTLGLGL